MRPAIATLLGIALIGGMFAYTQFLRAIRPQRQALIERPSAGTYSLRLVCTFDCAGDAFGNPAALIKFRDRELLREEGWLPAGAVLEIDPVEGIKVGANDFFVAVNPAEATGAPSGSAFELNPEGSREAASNNTNRAGEGAPPGDRPPEIARAFQLSVYRDGEKVSERVVWTSSPGRLSELVRLEVDR